MSEQNNVIDVRERFDSRRESGTTPFDDNTELYFHEASETSYGYNTEEAIRARLALEYPATSPEKIELTGEEKVGELTMDLTQLRDYTIGKTPEVSTSEPELKVA